MSAAPKKAPKGFDLARLKRMVAPFSIRIERYDASSGKTTPIPLPQEQWDLDDATRIEQIVLNDVSGGGRYAAQVVDASGAAMEWDFAFDPRHFPEKTPPLMSRAVATPSMAPPGPTPAAPTAPTGWTPGAFGVPLEPPPSPYVPRYQTPRPTVATVTYPQQPQQTQWPSWSNSNPWFWPSEQRPMSQPQDTTKLDALQRELENMRAQAMEAKHTTERERQAAQHRQELAALQTGFEHQIRELKEALTTQNTQRTEDPRLREIQTRLDEAQRQQAETQQRLERERQEAQHREEMRAMREAQEKQAVEMRELIRQMDRKSADPTLTMLMEVQRQNAEAQRESTRLQAEQARETARLATENPRVVMEMIERANNASGSEKIIGSIQQAYEGPLRMMQNVMQMMSGMQGSPGWEMADKALEAGRDVLDKFVTSKRDMGVATAQSQAAQAHAQVQLAAMRAQQMAADDDAEDNAEDEVEDKGEGKVPRYAGKDGDAGSDAPTKQNGTAHEAHEAIIFGEIYEQVLQLRAIVASGNMTPEQVAEALVQAALQVKQMNKWDDIPVMTLYADQRYADLIDRVLPGIPSEFATVIVKEIIRLRTATAGGGFTVNDKAPAPEVVPN